MPFSIPFLNLPLLPQHQILKSLSAVELYEFSQISPECKRVSGALNFKVPRLHWSVNPALGEYQIILFPSNNINTVSYIGYEQPLLSLSFMKNKKKVKRNMESMTEEEKLYLELSVDKDEEAEYLKKMEQLTDHLVQVFCIENFTLFTRSSFNLDHFTLQYTRKFLFLQIAEPVHFGRNAVVEVMPTSTLKFILEELDIKNLDLMCPVEPSDYKFPGPLQFESFHAKKAEWLRIENLLDMKCACFVYYALQDQIPAKFLNELLKTWISGGLPNLKEFQLSPTRSDECFSYKEDEVLKGIQLLGIIDSPMFIDSVPKHFFRGQDGRVGALVMHSQEFRFLVTEFSS